MPPWDKEHGIQSQPCEFLLVPYRKETWQRYYAKHREEIRKRARVRYWANRDKHIEKSRAYNLRNPSWIRLRRKRLEAIQRFGGICSRCGFSDWRALQFDHKDGDGSKDRRLHRHNNFGYYNYIMQNPNKFNLLCSNCNWIKRFELLENTQRQRNQYSDADQRSSYDPKLLPVSQQLKS
jgi:RNase P subunit RPR2